MMNNYGRVNHHTSSSVVVPPSLYVAPRYSVAQSSHHPSASQSAVPLSSIKEKALPASKKKRPQSAHFVDSPEEISSDSEDEERKSPKHSHSSARKLGDTFIPKKLAPSFSKKKQDVPYDVDSDDSDDTPDLDNITSDLILPLSKKTRSSKPGDSDSDGDSSDGTSASDSGDSDSDRLHGSGPKSFLPSKTTFSSSSMLRQFIAHQKLKPAYKDAKKMWNKCHGHVKKEMKLMAPKMKEKGVAAQLIFLGEIFDQHMRTTGHLWDQILLKVTDQITELIAANAYGWKVAKTLSGHPEAGFDLINSSRIQKAVKLAEKVERVKAKTSSSKVSEEKLSDLLHMISSLSTSHSQRRPNTAGSAPGQPPRISYPSQHGTSPSPPTQSNTYSSNPTNSGPLRGNNQNFNNRQQGRGNSQQQPANSSSSSGANHSSSYSSAARSNETISAAGSQ
jgi:hypothetical protein